MKIISFNLLNGAFHPGDRLAKITDLLRALEPDVCFLQECVDWPTAQLKLLGRSIGLKHGYLTECNPRGSKRRYNLGALSRKPFTQTQSHTPDLLAHGFQELKIEGCSHTIFHTHLVANSEEERLAELEWFLGEERSGILVGDLNSLSPTDPYPDDFAERLADSGVEKYGNPPSHAVMTGFHDAGWSAPNIEGEWVSRWRNELDPPLPTRTDYILAKGAAREALQTISVVPLENEESDHFPVVAHFSD
jgi:endonuclease/exonuclease/phosphatase family metal-dependent hydrolase